MLYAYPSTISPLVIVNFWCLVNLQLNVNIKWLTTYHIIYLPADVVRFGAVSENSVDSVKKMELDIDVLGSSVFVVVNLVVMSNSKWMDWSVCLVAFQTHQYYVIICKGKQDILNGLNIDLTDLNRLHPDCPDSINFYLSGSFWKLTDELKISKYCIFHSVKSCSQPKDRLKWQCITIDKDLF